MGRALLMHSKGLQMHKKQYTLWVNVHSWPISAQFLSLIFGCMFRISLRKLISLFALVLVGLSSFGQLTNFHHFDVRKFNLGFTMGLNVARFDMTNQINQRDPNTKSLLLDVEPVSKPGIYLGLVTNFKVINNIDVRFLPSVSLEQRDFDFIFDPGTTRDSVAVVRKSIEASNLNLPLVVKFKTDYYKRVRVYVAGGIQASFNLNSNKKVLNDPDLLKTQTTDFAFVGCFGIDLYGERLKLSPEFRFTRGLVNIYEPINTRFPRAISDLFSQLLVFTINFE